MHNNFCKLWSPIDFTRGYKKEGVNISPFCMNSSRDYIQENHKYWLYIPQKQFMDFCEQN